MFSGRKVGQGGTIPRTPPRRAFFLGGQAGFAVPAVVLGVAGVS
ncbi:hypothetical protein [Aquibium microcysteis]|nr:hypothetical protein [Aquibium microcysteis]